MTDDEEVEQELSAVVERLARALEGSPLPAQLTIRAIFLAGIIAARKANEEKIPGLEVDAMAEFVRALYVDAAVTDAAAMPIGQGDMVFALNEVKLRINQAAMESRSLLPPPLIAHCLIDHGVTIGTAVGVSPEQLHNWVRDTAADCLRLIAERRGELS